ncbi:hypothetical protein [Streptomyces griseus]|uniref:hypothetical protein n=1 Tax=Streptomyces griseus TaxID=1911 RepID=UPI0033B443CF
MDSGHGSLVTEWARERLIANGVPADGDWLHLGPGGPHVTGFETARCAALGGGVFCTVDLDPRWVKRLLSQGRGEESEAYVQHLPDQAETILESHEIAVLNAWSRLLPPALSGPASRALRRASRRGISGPSLRRTGGLLRAYRDSADAVGGLPGPVARARGPAPPVPRPPVARLPVAHPSEARPPRSRPPDQPARGHPAPGLPLPNARVR